MDLQRRLEQLRIEHAEKLVLGDSTIRLGQALKFSGIVENGAQAKRALASGNVLVNGLQETRRGRQLIDGDIISFSHSTGDDKGKTPGIVIAAN